jgi:hypothetical protein
LARNLATPLALVASPKLGLRQKKTRKVVQETVVEDSTQDPDVPPQAIRGKEQNDFKGVEDHDSHEDHENEEEQPNTILFTPNN